MAIIKKVLDKDVVIAGQPIIDHNQLAGRDGYGAHPISAIRKLPEKLYALKEKDKELDDKIDQFSDEYKEKVAELEAKDAELTAKIEDVEDHASQIDLVEKNGTGKLEFTNYHGEKKEIQGGFLPDDDTLHLVDNKMALKQVHNDNTTIKGTGTAESKLHVPIDSDTIIADNIGVRAVAISDGFDKITPNDVVVIDDKLTTLTNTYNEHKTESDAKFAELDETDKQHLAAIRELESRVKGIGGYLDAYDFGTATPTQEELNAEALRQIFDDGEEHAITEIFDQTKIKNLFDGCLWIFTNDGVSNAAWTNNGTEFINTATNEGVQGVVTGSYEYHEGFIDVLGHITINGLDEDLETINKDISDLDSELNNKLEETESVLTGLINDEASTRQAADELLQNNITNEVNRATAAEAAIVAQHEADTKTLTDNLSAEVKRSTETDEKLRYDLDTEVNRSVAFDNSFTERFNIEISNINTALKAETDRAIAADNEIKATIAADKVIADGTSIYRDEETKIISAIGLKGTEETKTADSIIRATTVILLDDDDEV